MKTYTIEEAGAALGSLAEETLRSAQSVVLVLGAKLLSLQPYDPPATGRTYYSPDWYSDEEVELENKMAEPSMKCAGLDWDA